MLCLVNESCLWDKISTEESTCRVFFLCSWLIIFFLGGVVDSVITYHYSILLLQSGPLPVKSRVITQLICGKGKKTPQSPDYQAIYRGPTTPFITIVGAHCVCGWYKKLMSLECRSLWQSHLTLAVCQQPLSQKKLCVTGCCLPHVSYFFHGCRPDLTC